jgi:CRP-like cAMP-binding protein
MRNVSEQKLYLIVSGTVAVYTELGDEVAHLHDANMFGEIAFLLHDANYVSR